MQAAVAGSCLLGLTCDDLSHRTKPLKDVVKFMQLSSR